MFSLSRRYSIEGIVGECLNVSTVWINELFVEDESSEDRGINLKGLEFAFEEKNRQTLSNEDSSPTLEYLTFDMR